MNQHFHNSKDGCDGHQSDGLLNDSDNELVSEIITVTISVSVITPE